VTSVQGVSSLLPSPSPQYEATRQGEEYHRNYHRRSYDAGEKQKRDSETIVSTDSIRGTLRLEKKEKTLPA
jgi:hypothetical protein